MEEENLKLIKPDENFKLKEYLNKIKNNYMKNETKFTKEYRKKLSTAIKDITQYLETRTGFIIKMDTELDPEHGFIYSIKISLDGKFSKYAKWCILSTSKQNIKKELLEKIANFDFHQNIKNGGSTKQIKKRVNSSARKINCCCCNETKPIIAGFHRNLFSPLLKESRNGYSLICFDCLYKRAVEVERQKDIFTAIILICGILDRPFIYSLANEINKITGESPVSRYGEYFRRLNLVPKKKKGKTFADSDFSEFIKINTDDKKESGT